MEICSICPRNGWEWKYEKPMVMLLAHLIEKHPDYTELAANRDPSIYAIVDNSIVEMGSSFSMERVYEAAKKVNANEIILDYRQEMADFTDGSTAQKVLFVTESGDYAVLISEDGRIVSRTK